VYRVLNYFVWVEPPSHVLYDSDKSGGQASGGLPWVVIYFVIVCLRGRVVRDGERLRASLGHWVGGRDGEEAEGVFTLVAVEADWDRWEGCFIV
jgi:hypothetical protein